MFSANNTILREFHTFKQIIHLSFDMALPLKLWGLQRINGMCSNSGRGDNLSFNNGNNDGKNMNWAKILKSLDSNVLLPCGCLTLKNEENIMVILNNSNCKSARCFKYHFCCCQKWQIYLYKLSTKISYVNNLFQVWKEAIFDAGIAAMVSINRSWEEYLSIVWVNAHVIQKLGKVNQDRCGQEGLPLQVQSANVVLETK